MKTELEYARLSALIVKIRGSWRDAFAKTAASKAKKEAKKAA